ASGVKSVSVRVRPVVTPATSPSRDTSYCATVPSSGSVAGSQATTATVAPDGDTDTLAGAVGGWFSPGSGGAPAGTPPRGTSRVPVHVIHFMRPGPPPKPGPRPVRPRSRDQPQLLTGWCTGA